MLTKAHILKASSEEVGLLIGSDQISRVDAQHIMRIWQEKGVTLSVITADEFGVYALYQDEFIHLPAIKTTIIDTVGAGDCFMANFFKLS